MFKNFSQKYLKKRNVKLIGGKECENGYKNSNNWWGQQLYARIKRNVIILYKYTKNIKKQLTTIASDDNIKI